MNAMPQIRVFLIRLQSVFSFKIDHKTSIFSHMKYFHTCGNADKKKEPLKMH